MPSSTSNFERVVPDLPWRGILLAAVLLTAVAAVGWEFRARALGYAPTLNDTSDLWAQARAGVRPDSIVLLGTSRILFDADLDLLEQGLGRRPIQLAIVGSTPFPVLADLAADESFHGTVILDVVPLMYFAPGGPLVENAASAVKRFHHWTWSQKWGHRLGMLLERNLACLRQEDLTLEQLIATVPIPNRVQAQLGPRLPPYFYSLEADRRARMVDQAAIVGSSLQRRVSAGWLPLFTPPPPPSYVPGEVFGRMMGQAFEGRVHDTAAAVARIRGRGGKVVFVCLPSTGPLRQQEDRLAPRVATWDRLVKESGVAAVHFQDYPDLKGFQCPEWSHLSAPDSVEFTRRLLPHLQQALSR